MVIAVALSVSKVKYIPVVALILLLALLPLVFELITRRHGKMGGAE